MKKQQERKHRSIGQKLQRCKSYQTQKVILDEWSAEWKKDMDCTIKLTKKALEQGNMQEAMHLLYQLDNICAKRFMGLDTIFKALQDRERILKDTEYESKQIDPETNVAQKEEKQHIEDVSVEKIVYMYKSQGLSIKEIASRLEFNEHKIIKILVTAGTYENETYTQVKRLRELGLSDAEIMSELGIGRATINDYTPYTKGIYGLNNPTENAKRIRKSRGKE